MLRVLLCMTCCNAPPSRQARPTIKTDTNNNLARATNDKLASKDSGIVEQQEKDQLLTNQIQAHNDNYGLIANKTSLALATSDKSVNKLMQDDDSITASTSAMLQKFKTNKEQEAYTKYTELNFDDKSVSRPSSIDVDEFKESLSERQQQQQQQQGELLAKPVSDYLYKNDFIDKTTTNNTTNNNSTNNSNYNYDNFDLEKNELLNNDFDENRTYNRKHDNDDYDLYNSTNNATTTAATEAKTLVSTTSRIGEYARLEYSPIEDLDSVTTKSHSRAGSEGGSRRYLSRRRSSSNFEASASGGARSVSGRSRPVSSSGGRSPSREGFSENISRRSSSRGGGIESTSISIASQLSNEQLQQNLTNMLESANSPTALFGTIGLPLGPPLLDRDMTETRKTSPETTGAALTSASQDSLSDGSLGSGDINQQNSNNGRRSGARTVDSFTNAAYSAGGALVNDSIEQQQQKGFNINSIDSTSTNTRQDSEISTIISKSSAVTSGIYSQDQDRVESALSMTTTTSGGLTNPTPTPSELSGGATGDANKKKGKLRPKNLLKRFKSGKKKNKNEEGS